MRDVAERNQQYAPRRAAARRSRIGNFPARCRETFGLSGARPALPMGRRERDYFSFGRYQTGEV